MTVTEARRDSNTHTHTPISRTHTVWHRHLVQSLGNTARQILTDHKLGYEHSLTKPEETPTRTDTQFPQVRVASPLPAGAPPALTHVHKHTHGHTLTWGKGEGGHRGQCVPSLSSPAAAKETIYKAVSGARHAGSQRSVMAGREGGREGGRENGPGREGALDRSGALVGSQAMHPQVALCSFPRGFHSSVTSTVPASLQGDRTRLLL